MDVVALMVYAWSLVLVYQCWSRGVAQLLVYFVHNGPRAHIPVPLPWLQSTLYVGPMFAEKTTQACKMLTHMLLEDEEARALVVRHAIDDRTTDGDLVTHGQQTLMQMMAAHDIQDANTRVAFTKCRGDLSEALQGDAPWYDIVVVDEAHFFDDNLTDVLEKFLFDKTVLLTGLRATYEQEPWAAMGPLMAYVDHVQVCYANCDRCKRPDCASHTKRRNAPMHVVADRGTVVAVGGKEMYYPVCAQCLRRA